MKLSMAKPSDGRADYLLPERPPHLRRSEDRILDSDGKLVDTVAGSKHRGLNRAGWAMRVKPPAVAPAASALFEAAQGPRVLPGTYTVKLTKGDQTYTEKLEVAIDPRAKYSAEERKAQFDLAMKVYKQLEHMTFAVEAIEGVRDAANSRAAKLGERVSKNDPLRKQLEQLAADCRYAAFQNCGHQRKAA